jgi:hypothetical protein
VAFQLYVIEWHNDLGYRLFLSRFVLELPIGVIYFLVIY